MKNRIVLLLLCALVTFCGCHNNKKYADLPEELATLCKNIDKHPKNSELYYQRANYYYLHKDVEKGIEDESGREEGISLCAKQIWDCQNERIENGCCTRTDGGSFRERKGIPLGDSTCGLAV